MQLKYEQNAAGGLVMGVPPQNVKLHGFADAPHRLAVGAGVTGRAVGGAVGVIVRATVGTGVGASVGATVGARVGAGFDGGAVTDSGVGESVGSPGTTEPEVVVGVPHEIARATPIDTSRRRITPTLSDGAN